MIQKFILVLNVEKIFVFTICCESRHISTHFKFFFPENHTLKFLKVKCNPKKKKARLNCESNTTAQTIRGTHYKSGTI